MIRYSSVSLIIPCKAEEVAAISGHLDFEPSEIREWRSTRQQSDGSMKDMIHHNWALHSPLSASQGDPTARLFALMEVIRPFSARLVTLDTRWHRWIDIVYHVTPQRPSSITGEFDWFRLPAVMMKLLGEWNLDVSYESFWFDHPDWKPPLPRCWSRFRRRFGEAT